MKTLQHKIKTPPSTTVLLVASGLLLLSFITYHFVYQQYKARQEKQQFEAASFELRQIAKEIQTKVGTADQVKEEKSCSYANRKFSQGPLRCAVSINFLYNGKNHSDASGLLRIAAPQIGNGQLRMFGQTKSEFVPYEDYGSPQSITQGITVQDFPGICEATYTYPALNDKGLRINLICGAPAHTEHFELDES